MQIGKVVSITDGDTIRVSMDGVDYPVRYIGVDSPETNEQYSQEATNRNTELVAGKDVVLVMDRSETDIYKRLLRYVFVDGEFVNDTLVKEGYAWAKAYPPDISCNDLFTGSQEEAKNRNIGVWIIDTRAVVIDTPIPATSSCPQGCIESSPGCEI